MNLRTSLLALFLVMTCTFSFSQRRGHVKRKSKSHGRGAKHGHAPINYVNNIQGAFFLGATKYVGDLASRTGNVDKANIAVGLGGQYRYNQNFTFRGDFNYNRIIGSDEHGKNAARNLSFKTNIYELDVTAVYDIFKFEKMYRRRKRITPYALLGFGAFYYNPKTDLNGETYSLREYETEGVKYSGVNFNVHFGGGLRVKLTPQLDISVEATWRKTFTDYLDDVSTIYPTDIASWDDPTRQALSMRQEGRTYESAAGKQRGNPDSKDGYLTFGFRLAYTIKVTQQRNNVRGKSSRLRVHKGIKKK
jgi:hypothetical protein